MIGRKFSHYEIQERLGAGGMGVVYKAYDSSLERHVALKFLSTSSSLEGTSRKRFLREARAASALEHRNICTIHEIGETDRGELFICMAYYSGRTLQEVLTGGKLPIVESIRFALEVVGGLSVAHRKGIVHRDIKSANVMITDEGEVKILDFGLAKLAESTKITDSGVAMGTLAYMSPEQAKGQEVDRRSDLFSFGIVLYEMVTGQPPFQGDIPEAVSHQIINENPKPLSEACPEAPTELQTVLDKALAKWPADRYQRAEEIYDDLLLVLSSLDPSRALLYARYRPKPHQLRRILKHATRVAVALALASIVTVTPVRNRIMDWLGFESFGSTFGVVVLPFEDQTTGAVPAVLATAVELTVYDALDRLTDVEPKMWVIPREVAMKRPGATIENARGQFDTDAVVTGRLLGSRDDLHVELNGYNANTNRSIGPLTINLSGEESAALPARFAHTAGELLTIRSSGDVRASPSEAQASLAYLLGRGFARANESSANPDSAVYYMRSVVERDSSFASGYAELGFACYSKGVATKDERWLEDAITYCDRAIALDPGCAAAHLTKGLAYWSAQERELAIESYRAAVAAAPSDPVPRRTLAWAYWREQRLQEAERVLEQAIEAVPGYWGPTEDLGYFYYVNGRYEDAIPRFVEVMKRVPDFQKIYNYLGAVYYAIEDWEKAIVMFEKSFELEKTYAACANLGTLYYMEGQYEKAAEMYEWAWEYNKHHMVLGNLAAALRALPDQRDRAADVSRRAIALARERLTASPDDAVLISQIGAEFASIGEHDSSLVYAERALALDPDHPEVLYRVAYAYEVAGERAKALVLIGRAMEAGYSRREIETEPSLSGLIKDSRFELLKRNAEDAER